MRSKGKDATRATAQQLGLYLFRAAAESAEKLKSDREMWEVPVKNGPDTYYLELLLYCLFPFELIVRGELGEHAAEVGDAMRAFLKSYLMHSVQGSMRDRARWDQLDEYAKHRFNEYLAELDPTKQRIYAEPVAILGYQRITGNTDVDPLPAMALSAWFQTTIKHMRDAVLSYAIVDPTTRSDKKLLQLVRDIRRGAAESI